MARKLRFGALVALGVVAVLALGGTALAKGGPGPRAAAYGVPQQSLMQAAATYLGMTQTALMTEHRAGKTLAEIATAKGKTVDGLVGVMVAAGRTRLDAAKAAGRLTADEAAQALKTLEQRVRDMVSREPGTGMAPGRGGCTGDGPHGPRR